jgi:hypothetical protein
MTHHDGRLAGALDFIDQREASLLEVGGGDGGAVGVPGRRHGGGSTRRTE